MGFEHLLLKFFKTRWGSVLGASFMCITSAAALYFFVPSGLCALRLFRQHVTITGEVIDSRIGHDLHHIQTHYELRYRFKIPGSDEWHFQTDNSGRKELWSQLTKPDWEAAVANGHVDIIYDPKDVGNNDLAVNLNDLQSSAVLQFVVGGVWASVGVIWMAVIIVRRFNKMTPLAPASVQ